MAKVDKSSVKVINNGAPFAFPYFMGVVGTAVYFVQKAEGFGEVLLALLQSLVWPAFLIHRIFEMLRV